MKPPIRPSARSSVVSLAIALASPLAAAEPPDPEARALSLADQGRDAASLAGLLAGPETAEIEVLDLSSNPIGDEGAEVLARAHLPKLTTLRLDLCGLGRRGGEALADMAALDGVKTLSISGASDLWEGHGKKPFLGPKGFAALVSSPHLATLEELNASLNAIGGGGARALARATHLAALRRVDLRANDIDDDGAAALIGAPHLEMVEILDLRDNPLSKQMEDALRARFGVRVLL